MTETVESPVIFPVPDPRRPYSDQMDKLAEALAKAQAEIAHAAKSVDNTFFKSKYADLPAVYDASRPALARNGLSVVQVTEFDDRDRMTLVSTLLHASGQWVRSWYPIRPVKNDPQSIGSALTYARRYAYSALVGVAAHGEDDDGNAASGRDKEPLKSPFANSALRNKFQENVTKSYRKADTLDALKELAGLNKEKFDAMKQAQNDHDLLLLDELRKEYEVAASRIKKAESHADAERAGFGDGFADTPQEIMY